MNANRKRIVVKGTGSAENSGRHALTMDQGALLCSLGVLSAILALWPMSLGHSREYTFLTLAALLVIRFSNWVRVQEDVSAIDAGVEVRWPPPVDFVFF